MGITIITSIISILGFYHKFIMKKIDEKVDQKLYDKEVEYMKTQTKYNYTNLKEKIETVFEDIKDNKRVYFKIEEFVLFFFY